MIKIGSGSKIKFTYKDKYNMSKQIVLTMSLDETLDVIEMPKEAAFDRLHRDLQKFPIDKLDEMGYLFAVRNLVYKCSDATEIEIEEVAERERKQTSDQAAGGLLMLAIIAFIIAVICFPLLVMLGMRGKLFLKGFYNKYEGDNFKAFIKNYTYIGIGLYALVAIMVAIDAIFALGMLMGPAFGILFFGGIAYFIGSLLFIKKKFAQEGDKINFIETLKSGFKKPEKKS